LGRIWAAQQAQLDQSFDPKDVEELLPPRVPSLSEVRGETPKRPPRARKPAAVGVPAEGQEEQEEEE